MEHKMSLIVGDKIVYPGRGPCRVGAVVWKMVCGASGKFYQLALLDGSGAELFVPVDSSRHLPMRALLDPSEIPALLGRLKAGQTAAESSGPAKNWRQRQL